MDEDDEEHKNIIDWIVGFPTLRQHSEERGNHVTVDFKFNDWTIGALTDLKVIIYNNDVKVSSTTLKNMSTYAEENGLTATFYDKVHTLGSWDFEKIEDAQVGTDIFNNIELKVVKGNVIYTFTSDDLRSTGKARSDFIRRKDFVLTEIATFLFITPPTAVGGVIFLCSRYASPLFPVTPFRTALLNRPPSLGKSL